MALCVVINPDGTLASTGEPVATCTGYVMVSGSEYGVYQSVQTALGAPTSAEAMGWFIGAWGAVMVFFIASRAAGSVISMFKD